MGRHARADTRAGKAVTPPRMTLTEIDQALEDWRGRIATATENLLALEDLPVVQRAQGGPGRAPLTGVTAAKVGPALALLPQLFQDIGLLTDAVDRAEALRRPLTPFWRPERALDQIEALLTGPAVALPSVQTPFAQRGLLSAPETAQAITLAALLALMSRTFADVKASLLEAQDAWTRLETSLAAAQEKAALLERMAAPLGETDAPDLVRLRAHLAALARQIASDPLGVPTAPGWDGAALLRQAWERLEGAAASREKTETLRAEAETLMTRWGEARRRHESVHDQCRAHLADPPPDVPDRLPEMRRWLATLEDACAQRRWQAASVGLEHWRATAQECLDREAAAAETCEARLETRAGLPGRLAALRAKAGARSLAADGGLAALGREADALLGRHPLPLAQADAAVTAYADRLNALLKERRPRRLPPG